MQAGSCLLWVEISPLPFGPWGMVLGLDVICDPQGGVLVVVQSLFVRGCLMEYMMVLGSWLVVPHLSHTVSKQWLLKEAPDSAGVGFVSRLMERQTLPIIMGCSSSISPVFLSWQVYKLDAWALLSPVFPSEQTCYSNGRWGGCCYHHLVCVWCARVWGVHELSSLIRSEKRNKHGIHIWVITLDLEIAFIFAVRVALFGCSRGALSLDSCFVGGA